MSISLKDTSGTLKPDLPQTPFILTKTKSDVMRILNTNLKGCLVPN